MAMNEGEQLGCAWGPILVSVSSISRLINMAYGGKDDAMFFSGFDGGSAKGSGSAGEREYSVERNNASLIASAVKEAEITMIFTKTSKLTGDAVAHFVAQLAAVSLSELSACVQAPSDFPAVGFPGPLSSTPSTSSSSSSSLPRIFSLQKVVEVADYNMDTRPRMVWTKLWSTLGRYFSAVCTSSSSSVAMFAIDSLKQLSLKFLTKPELKSFSFQKLFLSPLLAIMEATSRSTPANPSTARVAGQLLLSPKDRALIRELLLSVGDNIVKARTANMRSGWSSFLSLYALAAGDRDPNYVAQAFALAINIIDNHWESVASSGAFVDAVKCFSAFGSSSHDLVALTAIDRCTSLGAHLARGRAPLSEDPALAEKEWATVASLAEAAGRAAEEGGKDGGLYTTPGLNASEWYFLGGSEQADVVDDERDKGLLAKLPGNSALVDASAPSNSLTVRDRDPNAVTSLSGGGVDAENAGNNNGGMGVGYDELEPDIAEQASFHESAADVALMSADVQRSGLIRRFTDSFAHTRLWWPLITGLARLITRDTRLPVRMRALHSLHSLLRRYGPGFSLDLWKLVYNGVLLPMFDDVGSASVGAVESRSGGGGLSGRDPESPSPAMDMEGGAGASKPHYSLTEFSTRSIPAPALVDPSRSAWGDKSVPWGAGVGLAKWRAGDGPPGGDAAGAEEWLRTTCMPALSSLIKLHSRFFARLHTLSPSLLSLIECCIDQEIEGLARIGCSCFRLFLAVVGPRFTQDTWGMITATLQRLFAVTEPRALFESRRLLLGPTEEEKEEEAKRAREVAAATAAAAAAAIEAKEAELEALTAEVKKERGTGACISTSYGTGIIVSGPRPTGSSAGGLGGEGIYSVHFPFAKAFLLLPAHPQAAALAEAIATHEGGAAPSAVAAVPKKPTGPKPSQPPAPTPSKIQLPFSQGRVIVQCLTQLELIGAVSVLAEAHIGSLTLDHVETLLNLLQSSADFARRFNGDRLLRSALWDAGFTRREGKEKKLPSLLRQEGVATQSLLILLFRLYGWKGVEGEAWRAMSLKGLTLLIKGILSRYNALAADVQRAQLLALPAYMHSSLQFTSGGGCADPTLAANAGARDELLKGEHSKDLFREAASYGPLVLQLLDGLLGLHDGQFTENLPWLYPLLTGLISAGSVEIRQRVGKIFETKIRELLPIPLE